jgi:hypothetical protein
MDLHEGNNLPYIILSGLVLGALGILIYWLMFIQQVRLQDILARKA